MVSLWSYTMQFLQYILHIILPKSGIIISATGINECSEIANGDCGQIYTNSFDCMQL